MICHSKDKMHTRFNPVLGSSYKLIENDCELTGKEYPFIIRFNFSSDGGAIWHFSTIEAAQETLEWLDQLYGVKFIPNEILKQENK